MTAAPAPFDASLPRSFSSVVSDIQELARSGGQTLWRIALDPTEFAPGTTGRLTATAPSGASLTVAVVGVEADASGTLWHHTHKPLQTGTPVRATVDAAPVHPA
jgi:alanyl-tRNA synthetase